MPGDVDITGMETQKATNQLDMPHATQPADHSICICGREASHGLHNLELVTELATHREPLQTERGS